jgi:hypothetical protein
MHACVAKRLLREPALAVQALKRLEKLREINPHGRRHHDRWQELLQGPSVELVRVMNECSEMADELRKESPMSVFVSPVERQRIFEATRAASSEEDASPDSSHRPPWEELRALGGSTRVTANESVWTDEENGRGR